MYVQPNFKTKKAFREAVSAGCCVAFYQPGPFGGNEPRNGEFWVEGPHYPEPHRWYATATVCDGKIVKVK